MVASILFGVEGNGVQPAPRKGFKIPTQTQPKKS